LKKVLNPRRLESASARVHWQRLRWIGFAKIGLAKIALLK
jgi:hypothetical protein